MISPLRHTLYLLVIGAALVSCATPVTGPQDITPVPTQSGTGRLVFVGRHDDISTATDIFVTDTNGANPTRLTNDLATDNTPTWSPDGKRIAFVSKREGRERVYVMASDGTNVTRITDSSTVSVDPAWSPDGSQIVYSTVRHLFIARADGSEAREVVTDDGILEHYHPSWSPDGRYIAFAGTSGMNVALYVVAVDGSRLFRLTSSAALSLAQSPNWSPDGSQIVFTTIGRNAGDIERVAANGTARTVLSGGTPNDMDAVWSPDGKQIAFTSFTNGTSGIYMANADGSARRKLLDKASQPDWQP